MPAMRFTNTWARNWGNILLCAFQVLFIAMPSVPKAVLVFVMGSAPVDQAMYAFEIVDVFPVCTSR